MKNYYQGKRVLITGASSGIGFEMARQLAPLGASLVLVARREDKLRELAESLRVSHKVDVQVFSADLAQEGAAQNLHKELQAKNLGVDILINNAGVGYRGAFVRGDWRRQRDMMRLNVDALVDLTHFFLPAMLERRQGGILNVGSVAGFQPLPFMNIYSASKAFVNTFTEALWKECQGTGVHVSVLCPGPVSTEFFGHTGGSEAHAVRPNMQTGVDVARMGLEGLARNNPKVVTSAFAWSALLASKLLPSKWMLSISDKVTRKSLPDMKA